MKIKDKIRLLFAQPLFQAYKMIYPKPKVMDSQDTIAYILKNKCSVSRFGDGELDLILGIDIRFQEALPELSRRLKKVASTKNSNILVCIPRYVVNTQCVKKELIEPAAKFWTRHAFALGGVYNKFFHGLCGDTQFTRFYVDLCQKKEMSQYVMHLKQIWNSRNILLVEGERSRLGIGNDLFDNVKSVRRIQCPNEQAFLQYEKIYGIVINNVKENDLVLCALGPTATVLCYDLSLKGIQAIDVGHVDIEYEWYLAGAKEKISILGKDTSEVCNSFVEDITKIPKDVVARIEP